MPLLAKQVNSHTHQLSLYNRVASTTYPSTTIDVGSMAVEKLPVVVVGGNGLIGKRHCQHVVDNQDTTLIALVDPNPAAKAIAASFNVPVFPSIDLLLDSTSGPVTKPKAAIVCTPNSTHVPLSTALLRAGIHTLCEKPISTDLSSARRLIEEAAKTDEARLLIGHHRRFNPYVVAMKDILESGLLGDITAVMGCWTTYKPDSYFEGNCSWRLNRNQGGGVILINFVHEIDLLQYFFGAIVKVHAEKATHRRSQAEDAVEEGAAITLRFESGVVGTFIISDAVASSQNFEAATGENPMIPQSECMNDVYRVFGTKGTLGFPSMRVQSFGGKEASWQNRLVNDQITVKNADVVPLTAQLQHFVRVCRGEEAPKCSGEDGLKALEACEMVRDQLYA